jgi:hypothetical protein
MPEVVTRIPDALELMRYGYFYPWKYPVFTIDAADAITITAAQTNTYFDRYTATTPTETVTPLDLSHFEGVTDWCAMICHWHFGYTSRPDKVYFQIIEHGRADPQQFKTDYVAGGYVSDSNIETYTILPPFDNSIDLQFWNVSSPAEDVWIDLALTFFLFPKANLQHILDASYASLARAIIAGESPNGTPADNTTIVEQLQYIARLLEKIAGTRVQFEKDWRR